LQVFGAAFVGGGTSTSAALITADTTNFDGELSGADTNLQTIADRIDDYDSILNYAGSKTYRPGNVFLVTDAGDEGIWQVNPASGFTSTTWGTDKSNCTRIAVQAVGNLPIGSIIAWQGGYYTNGSNAGFTNVLGNTVANANAYLNPFGIYVCDGAAVNDAASPIFNAAGRYLPNLTDSRFLMGSTAAGTPGGANSNNHTHSVTSNVSVSNHTLSEENLPAHAHSINHDHASFNSGSEGAHKHAVSTQNVQAGGSYTAMVTNAGTASVTGIGESHLHSVDVPAYSGNSGNGSGTATAISHSVSNPAVTSAVPSDTENRPLYLSTFYVMRIK
jgi:hypothetical protein